MREILRRHTELSADKSVSYLPLNTIVNLMGISVAAYTAVAQRNAASYLVFDETNCCIASGAVYAFLPDELGKVLDAHKDVLAASGIPGEPIGFIRAIAGTWFEREAVILPLINKVFGEGE